MTTERTKVGRIGTGNIDRLHTAEFALRISETDLVAVSNPFMEATETYITDHPSLTLYNDYHSPLTETVLICLNTNTHLQLIVEPGPMSSISFPPFCCREQEQSSASDIFI